MKYTTLEHTVSSARLNKYLRACNGDKKKALLLYKYNVVVCQRFAGTLNMFEVILRNKIHVHYAAQYADEEWIIHQTLPGLMLYNDRDLINETLNSAKKKHIYSSDRMVSSFTLGFWTYMFTKQEYRLGGKTLLNIFSKRAKGTTQKQVYCDLTAIREFRNRIAHHEPIVFDAKGDVSVEYMENVYGLMQKYLIYMGFQAEDALSFSEKPDAVILNIKKLI